jgi:hypothetical protein
MSVKRTPGRPSLSREDYYWKYHQVVFELTYLMKSLRTISRDNHVSLSTVVRIKKRFRL